MTRTFALLGVMAVAVGVHASTGNPATQRQQRAAPPMTASHADGGLSIEAQNALVGTTCVACHNDRAKAGGLSLARFDAAKIHENAEIAEKMIHKLRAGMMPPQSARNRPDVATLRALAAALEAPLDRAAAGDPNPGRRTFQRLNRAEYRRAIRELLGLDVDANAFLPPDRISHGFDNIADEQVLSPALIQGYLSAATKIAAIALGSRTASAGETTYKVPRTQSQMRHIQGTPWGTRGGISVVHTFPADGDYTFRLMLHSGPTGGLFGSAAGDQQIDVSVNGARVALLTVNSRMDEKDEHGMNLVTPPVHVTAGPQHVAIAFIQQFESPIDDLLAPIDHTLADTLIGDDVGITALPHLRDLSITGPFEVTGVSDTPSRVKILVCRPASVTDEAPCARQILQRLASAAYRQPTVSSSDVQTLMSFYEQGRQGGDFETGIRRALQAILASPRFLFRFEEIPGAAADGENYRISDVDLASRLSYFLWAAPPDAELLTVAAAGGLSTADSRDAQVRRMLADPRAESLSTRFAAQWLRLQDLDEIQPDAVSFPAYDHLLGQSFKRETELLFDSIVRADGNVLDLLTADYTFVNDRIAKHYGIPNITGHAFRRVPLGAGLEYRRGILGHGSILMLTSVADRTSPVMRGKWVMEVLLGSPPPPPPPNVPELEETQAAAGAKFLSVRERMEQHRANPACASCHRVIDPLGLALENFDVTGAYRIKDHGQPIDASGEFYDGTPMNGPAGLRQALLSHSDIVLRNFTENLMKYALGRRIEYFDQPTVRAIVRKAEASGNRFSSFVLGVVNSAAFQMSRVDLTIVENAPSAGGSATEPRR